MTIEHDDLLNALGSIWGAHAPTEPTAALLTRTPTGESRMLIDGELTEAASGNIFLNIDPTTETPLGEVADAGPEDIDRAISAARRAFDTTSWSTDPALRRHCLMQLHAALTRSADQLRATAVRETGIAVRTTYAFHSDLSISYIPYFAELATNYEYEHPLPDQPWAPGTKRLVRHEAVGVVAAITPWNFPLYSLITKLAPALAAGSTVILKPAPQSPWHATLIARIISEETDFPPGVINIVPTADNAVAEILTRDPRIDMVHFTGSTIVGKRVMANAAERVARVSLELGGKSANILMPDVDLDAVLPVAAGMVCMNAGQGCVLPTRMLVPRTRYHEATELAKLIYETIPYGDPADPDVVFGPQISSLQRDRILGLVGKGVDEGARLIAGGGKPSRFDKGFFMEPTLFIDVHPDSTIAQQEIFGPVLSITPYETVGEAIDIANNSTYGLACNIWGSDEDEATAVSRRIRAGAVSINGGLFYAPDLAIGGFKQSGLGRESGIEGFEEFLETKAIAIGQ
ncbi:aldehyde dehydrogenase family protein [Nocardia carnea]|uniref:aldehyde dehydrogenase family protein n=1 Tax=Nocardia carnea TaxID=37328 RepID=UPI0024575A65|nr:aldehyde dehydrogenase family protein [Nocardia carnea]